MATKTRIRRKDLRRPDEFVTLANRAANYARAHARPLGWAATITGVLVVVGFSLLSFRSVQRQRANAELGEAMATFHNQKYPQAETMFEDFAQKWASSDKAAFARFFAGQAALAQGHYEQAAVSLEGSLPGLGEEYLKQEALAALGFALEGKKDYTGATQRFGEAAALRGPYRESALLGQARTAELAGDKAAAKGLYKQFLNDYPNSTEAARVRTHVAALS